VVKYSLDHDDGPSTAEKHVSSQQADKETKIKAISSIYAATAAES
jgi:hypothetical protein